MATRKNLAMWSPEAVESLKALHLAGKTHAEIADEMGGITRDQVSGKLHRLGLSRPVPPPKPKAESAKLSRPFNPAYTERAPPTQPELEILEPLLTDGKPVTIRNCTDRTCRWPMSEASADMVMCGRTVKAGTPYCESHARKVYQSSQNQASRQRQAEATADAIG